jgi:N-acetylmuramoyl-L-alanine amidase
MNLTSKSYFQLLVFAGAMVVLLGICGVFFPHTAYADEAVSPDGGNAIPVLPDGGALPGSQGDVDEGVPPMPQGEDAADAPDADAGAPDAEHTESPAVVDDDDPSSPTAASGQDPLSPEGAGAGPADQEASASPESTAIEPAGKASLSPEDAAAGLEAASPAEMPVETPASRNEAAAPAMTSLSPMTARAASLAKGVDTKIMGASTTTVDQMVNRYRSTRHAYPAEALKWGGAPSIYDFCTILYHQAQSEGVRAEVVFAQAMHETGWLQFGGDVNVRQFNFAGIGATGGGAGGASFGTVAQGLLAQVQHLKAYATPSSVSLNNTCVDPRFHLVERGCAPTVEELGGKWAIDPEYGSSLKNQLIALQKESKQHIVSGNNPAIANGTYYISPKHVSGKALEVASASVENGGNVMMSTRSSKKSQMWKLTFDGKTGYYTITSINSGKVLDVAGAKATAGSNVAQWQGHGGLNQRWIIVKDGNGYSIASALKAASLVLDVAGKSKSNGANVHVWTKEGGDSQRFTFTPVPSAQSAPSAPAPKPGRTIEDGLYYINVTSAPGKVFDVRGGSASNSAQVIIYQKAGFDNQKWRISYDGQTGYYRISALHSGKSLDATGSSARKGTRLIQFSPHDGLNQKWGIVKNGDGTYKIASALGGSLVVDIAGSSTANSSEVILWGDYGQKNQRFTFTPIETTSRIYLDAGHGRNSSGNGAFDPGATGNGYREADLTAWLANKTASYAKSLYGLDVYSNVGSGVEYWNRQKDAKQHGCTSLVSIHFNAGGGTGSESYIHSTKAHARSAQLQDIVHPQLINGMGLADRGQKTGELAVVNGSNNALPAVLIEVCFIDNRNDMNRYLSRRDTVARKLAYALKVASSRGF